MQLPIEYGHVILYSHDFPLKTWEEYKALPHSIEITIDGEDAIKFITAPDKTILHNALSFISGFSSNYTLKSPDYWSTTDESDETRVHILQEEDGGEYGIYFYPYDHDSKEYSNNESYIFKIPEQEYLELVGLK